MCFLSIFRREKKAPVPKPPLYSCKKGPVMTPEARPIIPDFPAGKRGGKLFEKRYDGPAPRIVLRPAVPRPELYVRLDEKGLLPLPPRRIGPTPRRDSSDESGSDSARPLWPAILVTQWEQEGTTTMMQEGTFMALPAK